MNDKQFTELLYAIRMLTIIVSVLLGSILVSGLFIVKLLDMLVIAVRGF